MAQRRRKEPRPEIKDCSKLINTWLDEFRAGMATKPNWMLKSPRPMAAVSPTTAWGGPLAKEWTHVPEHMFFSIKHKPVFKKNGQTKYKKGQLREVIARNYQPTWILEYVLQSLYANTDQKHMLRPNSYHDLPVNLDDETSLEDITLYIYGLYEDMMAAENVRYQESLQEGYSGSPRAPRIYGHWSMYPIFLNDHTHPYVLDELRRKVNGPTRKYVIAHALKLRKTERRFFNWIERHGAMIILEGEDDHVTREIALRLKDFSEECVVYDRPKK